MCEKELETEQNCNILISPAPPDIAVCRSRSPGLLNWGPEVPASLGHVLIPASSHQLVWSPKSLGIPGGPSAGLWLSLPHFVSYLSDLQLNRGSRGLFCWVVAFSTTSCLQRLWPSTYWLPVFTELYNSSIAHSIIHPIFGMACLIVIKRK